MDIVIRVVVLYVFLMVAFRLIGKREFSQMEPFELVTLLLIPHIAAKGMVEDLALVNVVIVVSTIFLLVFAVTTAAYLSRPLGRLIEGEPVVLVRDGALQAEHLNAERISPEEVAAELRKAGLERVAQLKWAVLETDGRIGLVPHEEWVRRPRGHEETL